MTLTEQARSAKDIEGINLRDVSPGEILLVRTINSDYSLIYLGHGRAKIAGNPKICRGSLPVNVLGSTWGGSALRIGFVGIGMCLQFQRPGEARMVTTTPVRSVVRLGRIPAIEELEMARLRTET